MERWSVKTLVVGLVALAAVVIWVEVRIEDTTSRDSVQVLEDRLSVLESELESRLGVSLFLTPSRRSLETRLRDLERAVGTGFSFGSISSKVESLERTVRDLKRETGTGLISSGFGSLESRVTRLENQTGTDLGSMGFGSLESRLSRLESRVNSLERDSGGLFR